MKITLQLALAVALLSSVSWGQSTLTGELKPWDAATGNMVDTFSCVSRDCSTFSPGTISNETRPMYSLVVKDGPDGPGEYVFDGDYGRMRKGKFVPPFSGSVTYEIHDVKITVFQSGKKLLETRIRQFHAAVNMHDAAWKAAMQDNCSHKWFADSHAADCNEVK
jgi:hypothetical protein